jgi:hypothetical protein
MRVTLLLLLGWLLLFIPEILRVFLIMPFPGSQVSDTIDLAYFLHRYLNVFRIAGGAIVLYSLYHLFRRKGSAWRYLNIVPVILYALVFYLTNFIMLADKMFVQPGQKIFAGVDASVVDKNRLVVGITINGDSKAYPIQLIGYHHQVRDTVGGTPLLVMYCTVCRTARVYSPYINGQYEQFRLVGMDHFNAMFEDATTKSWWRQETGEAITGPLKGKSLDEIPSQQMALQSWIDKHPETLILQPDPAFTEEYAALTGFDHGTIKNDLEGTNPSSWELKSWIVGMKIGDSERAYDWNDLKERRLINDTLDNTPIVLMLENDLMSFHAYKRLVDGKILQFEFETAINQLLILLPIQFGILMEGLLTAP